MTQSNSDALRLVGGDNVYTDPTLVGGGWQATEGDRLKSMDEYFGDATTRPILEPVLRSVIEARGEAGTTVVDIGAGTGTRVEDLARELGATYSPYDVNQAYLEQRPAPTGRKILGNLNTDPQIMPPDQEANVIFARAVVPWTVDTEATIGKILTAATHVAVIGDYDWTHAAVISRDTDVVAAGFSVVNLMQGILTSVGFRPRFGAELGSHIDSVAQNLHLDHEREEIRHQPPEADHRDLFSLAVQTLIQQLREHGRSQDGDEALGREVLEKKARALAGARLLEGYAKVINDAPQGSVTIRLPALVTNIVRIKRGDEAVKVQE